MPNGTNPFRDTAGILGINSYVVNHGNYNLGSEAINLLVNDPDNLTQYYVLRYWNQYLINSKSIPLTSDNDSTIISFQTDTEDYTIVCNIEGVYESHDTNYTLIPNAPKTPIYTVDDHRIFALNANVLSWCDPRYNKLDNWRKLE